MLINMCFCALPSVHCATAIQKAYNAHLADLVWQALYYYYVIVARKEKIKQGRATSFTFLINDKKRLIGKIAAKVPEQYREFAFMVRLPSAS